MVPAVLHVQQVLLSGQQALPVAAQLAGQYQRTDQDPEPGNASLTPPLGP